MKLISASGLENKFKKKNEKYCVLGGWLHNNKFSKFESNLSHVDYKTLVKKYKIRTYLPSLREKLINQLVPILNNIHNKNYNHKYWTIIIDPWLSYYLIQNYYRWILVTECLNSNKKLRSLYFKKIEYSSIFDQNEFFFLISNSKNFNQFTFQRIYKFFVTKKIKSKLKVTYVNTALQKDGFDYKIKKKKNFLNFFLESFLGFFSKNNYFFLDFKGNKVDFIKLNYGLRQLPFRGSHIFSRNNLISFLEKKKNFDKKIRDKIKINKQKNNFEKFISEVISNDIPSSLIENYKGINKKIEKIGIKPKLIYSDTEYMHNTYFKFWLAKMSFNKIPFYTGQHGGYWGNNTQPIHFNDVFTKFNSKWHTKIRKNNFQMPAPQLTKFVDMRLKNLESDNLLFIGHNTTQFPRYLGTGPISNEVFDQIKIIKSLTKNISINKNFFFRPYKHTRYWKIEDEIYKEKIQVVEEDRYYRKIFKTSKVIITTHPRTAFLEALISGPTIIILNKNYYIEDGKMLNMMKKLKDAKIMFSSGKDLQSILTKYGSILIAGGSTKKL